VAVKAAGTAKLPRVKAQRFIRFSGFTVMSMWKATLSVTAIRISMAIGLAVSMRKWKKVNNHATSLDVKKMIGHNGLEY
jgi:hypothetical protein